MHDIGTFPAEECREFLARIACPNCPLRQTDPIDERRALVLMVAADIGQHFMPEAAEQLAFLFEDDVLATRLLVHIVYKKDFHDRETPFTTIPS